MDAGRGEHVPVLPDRTPASDDFQRAMREYGAGFTKEIGAAQAWAAGKLFEKAAARLPEPPTKEALLLGLWSIKNETLGGLTQPLTFNENQPATIRACWFTVWRGRALGSAPTTSNSPVGSTLTLRS